MPPPPNQDLTLPLTTECPYPDLYWAERPYSIIMEVSQFDPTKFDSSCLLALLRDQYPQGISMNRRMIKKYNNRSKSKSNRKRRKALPFIEIGFPDESTREQAFERPFILNGQTIQVSKTLDKTAHYGNVYRIHVYDIDKLSKPSKYYDQVLRCLNEFGKVMELHMHYAEAGDWFTGEGCAIWIGKENASTKEFGFYTHPKLDFAVNTYKVND
ncbi:hypothetical protein MAM1_0015d01468 [Mucor ambiguus]|uniref:Uncharacterized protein n=1 Tax=Mucor ambiguus TaxID=91626 RepID=A0A0C9M5Y8_9FUNG|nr:hypothetical protein MAM1_0015d01468 [Mucor ambiguus]